MSITIDSIKSGIIQNATVSTRTPSAAASSNVTSDFTNMLNAALDQTSSLQNEAQAMGLGLLTGETESVHSVVLAAEKADLSLRLTLQVRNKALDAYNEIMKMQI